MPSTPKVNWILAGIYVLLAVVVLVLAIVSPPVRAVAYAPLRDLVLPEPEPIVLSLPYSTEKAAWLDEGVGLARSLGWVRLVIIWNVGFTTWDTDPQAGYSIVRPDGTCPACVALGS